MTTKNTDHDVLAALTGELEELLDPQYADLQRYPVPSTITPDGNSAIRVLVHPDVQVSMTGATDTRGFVAHVQLKLKQSSDDFSRTLFNRSFLAPSTARHCYNTTISNATARGFSRATILPPLLTRSDVDLVLEVSDDILVILYVDGPMIPVLKHPSPDNIRDLYSVRHGSYIRSDNFHSVFALSKRL